MNRKIGPVPEVGLLAVPDIPDADGAAADGGPLAGEAPAGVLQAGVVQVGAVRAMAVHRVDQLVHPAVRQVLRADRLAVRLPAVRRFPNRPTF